MDVGGFNKGVSGFLMNARDVENLSRIANSQNLCPSYEQLADAAAAGALTIYQSGMCIMYKALPTAGGIRHPLRSLRKERYNIFRGADRGPHDSLLV